MTNVYVLSSINKEICNHHARSSLWIVEYHFESVVGLRPKRIKQVLGLHSRHHQSLGDIPRL